METDLATLVPTDDEADAVRALVQAARAWCIARTAIVELKAPMEREKLSHQALDALMTACEAIQCMEQQAGIPRDPWKLLALLHRETRTLIPSAEAEPLLEGTANHPHLTAYALDLLDWVEMDPDAQKVEAGFQAVMETLRARYQTDPQRATDAYRTFRRGLIEAPLLSQSQIVRNFRTLNISWKTFYEAIPASCLIGPGEPYVSAYQCHGCNWTLQRRWDGHLACLHKPCREGHQALYAVDEGGNLRPLKGGAVPHPQNPEELRRVRPFVWRRFVLPGLQELGLEQQLRRVNPEISIELWPQLDAYDLRVVSDSAALKIDLKIDVKAWRNPHALAEHLQKKRPAGDVIIAIPDAQSLSRPRVPGVKIMTFSELCFLVGKGKA